MGSNNRRTGKGRNVTSHTGAIGTRLNSVSIKAEVSFLQYHNHNNFHWINFNLSINLEPPLLTALPLSTAFIGMLLFFMLQHQ